MKQITTTMGKTVLKHYQQDFPERKYNEASNKSLTTLIKPADENEQCLNFASELRAIFIA